jgi:muramoyltetrapeptide carboxypeptidase
MAKTPSLLLPPALKKGATIGIVSPGRWMPAEELATTASRLRAMGYDVYLHPQNAYQHHQYAGNMEQRADAIEDLFADPEIDAILCAKGGTGSLWLLDILNYDIIRKNPKIFCGFSDVTALLNTITAKTGLVTFHGPMLHNLRPKKPDPLTWNHWEGVLSGDMTPLVLTRADNHINTFVTGTAKGRLVGGNLCLLSHLLGTSTDVDTDGCILFIEDECEALYAIDRFILHLKRAGKLDKITGLIVGEFTDIPQSTIPYGFTIEDMVQEALDGRDIPVVTNVPCGHGTSLITLPMGAEVELGVDPDVMTLRLTNPVVNTTLAQTRAAG